MSRQTIPFLLAISLGLTQAAAAASWSYRGTLEADGKPAEGRYDVRFTLYDSAQGGRALAPAVTVVGVDVQRGELLARPDLGGALDAAGSAWLGVEVAAHGEAFEALPERQSVASKALAAGVCWDTTGNAGNVDGTNFLGNSDNIPLDLRVNNKRVGRYTRPLTGAVNVLMGASSNAADGGVFGATIAGGGGDGASPAPNLVHGNYGTIGGGIANEAGGASSTVAGGENNKTSAIYATIGGGDFNTVSGAAGTVGGGYQSGAAGQYSTVPGGYFNFAGGDYSFAAGQGAVTRPSVFTGTPGGDEGTFVWADNSDHGNQLSSSGPNQFLVRALGGIAFNGKPNSNNVEFSIYGNNNGSSNVDLYMQPGGPTANFGYLFVVDGTIQSNTNWTLYHSNANGTFTPRLQVTPAGFLGINRSGATSPIVVGTSGTTGNGALLTGGGTWTNGSSRAFKHNFAPVDPQGVLEGVLALPIQTWDYRESDEGRHLGPVAEDFKSVFGLGGDPRYIATVDESGVALAAIQGLAHRLEAERAANQALEARVAELEARLERASQ